MKKELYEKLRELGRQGYEMPPWVFPEVFGPDPDKRPAHLSTIKNLEFEDGVNYAWEVSKHIRDKEYMEKLVSDFKERYTNYGTLWPPEGYFTQDLIRFLTNKPDLNLDDKIKSCPIDLTYRQLYAIIFGKQGLSCYQEPEPFKIKNKEYLEKLFSPSIQ